MAPAPAEALSFRTQWSPWLRKCHKKNGGEFDSNGCAGAMTTRVVRRSLIADRRSAASKELVTYLGCRATIDSRCQRRWQVCGLRGPLAPGDAQGPASLANHRLRVTRTRPSDAFDHERQSLSAPDA
jgi:hypothetical protein